MKTRSLLMICSSALFILAGCSSNRQTSSLPLTSGTQAPTPQATQAASPPAATPVTLPTDQTTQPATTVTASQPASSATPMAGAASTTPSPPTTTSNRALKNRLTNTCDLLNSNDLAKILVTGELEREPVQTNPVNHPVFSSEQVPATEVNCVFYEFHNPGKKDQELLQVTYWVDLPGQGTNSAAWQKAWTDAAQAGQPVSGVGEQAFLSKDGEMSFSQDGLYFTLQIVDTSRTAQQNQQIGRQIAADMLANLALMQKSGG